MNPFLSFLSAVALVAAPVEPGAPGKRIHLQKLVDGLAWKEPAEQPLRPLAPELPDDQLTFRKTLGRAGHVMDVLICGQDGKLLHAWTERGHGVLLVRDRIVYRADYRQAASGCAVIAHDLRERKELWKTALKGLGPIDHSKYHNRVWMERLDDDVLAVYGRESAGRYVELVEFKTGRTVGHKVFPRD